jgi:tRNA/rRNA methyltransferase
MSFTPPRVILVRPEEAGNVGASARVLKNFGLSHLVLVDPRMARPEEAYKWAHGAEEIVEGADVASDLAQALAPCTRAWAATRRRGRHRGPARPPRHAAGDIEALAASGQAAAWVFGPESHGLTTTELAQCSDRVSIPTAPGQPSLNLAQAVAVCCYETFLAGMDPAPPAEPQESLLEERSALYRHLEEALVTVGFVSPPTAESRMSAIRRIVERARPSSREVRLLRGLARRVLWAGTEARVRTRADVPVPPHDGESER